MANRRGYRLPLPSLPRLLSARPRDPNRSSDALNLAQWYHLRCLAGALPRPSRRQQGAGLAGLSWRRPTDNHYQLHDPGVPVTSSALLGTCTPWTATFSSSWRATQASSTATRNWSSLCKLAATSQAEIVQGLRGGSRGPRPSESLRIQMLTGPGLGQRHGTGCQSTCLSQ
jgi:hypothetical protein